MVKCSWLGRERRASVRQLDATLQLTLQRASNAISPNGRGSRSATPGRRLKVKVGYAEPYSTDWFWPGAAPRARLVSGRTAVAADGLFDGESGVGVDSIRPSAAARMCRAAATSSEVRQCSSGPGVQVRFLSASRNCSSSSGITCAGPSRFGLTSTARRKNSRARRVLPKRRWICPAPARAPK